MKKQQVIYIFTAIFLMLAFLFMLTNTTTYNPGFDSYVFQRSLANSAAMSEGMEMGPMKPKTISNMETMHMGSNIDPKKMMGGMGGMDYMGGMDKKSYMGGMDGLVVKKPFTTKDGMTGLTMAPVENQFQTIVPYLDNARGPQCAGTSNGVTATGGPLCLTSDQQRAMASRGGNSELNHCKPYNM